MYVYVSKTFTCICFQNSDITVSTYSNIRSCSYLNDIVCVHSEVFQVSDISCHYFFRPLPDTNFSIAYFIISNGSFTYRAFPRYLYCWCFCFHCSAEENVVNFQGNCSKGRIILSSFCTHYRTCHVLNTSIIFKYVIEEYYMFYNSKFDYL